MNQRPIVLGIHGDPSAGKTTLSLTAGNAQLLDFDKGYDRAGIATDPYPVHRWDDAVDFLDSEEFALCDVVVIDTAKTCLDNFLADYVMKQDYKNKRGNVLSLQGYGALGNEFKVWLNRIRQAGKDVVWIAHTKDEKDGDNVVKTPNITGGSYDLLMQCTDQCGFMTTQQGKRVIKFGVHETYRSKDSAYIGQVSVPAINHPSYGLFLYDLIGKVKESLADRSKKAVSRGEIWMGIKRTVSAATDGPALTDAFNAIRGNETLTEPDKNYAKAQLTQRARELGVKFNVESKQYESIEQPVTA